MKQYLQAIKSTRSVSVYIAYYADTTTHNYRIYYCGSDTGERYSKLGNAARRLEKYAESWKMHGVIFYKVYATKNEIPRRGSNA